MDQEDLLRNFVSAPMVIFAAFAYLLAPMVALGVHSAPQPALASAIAAGALLLGFGGYRLAIGNGKSAYRTILNVVLIIGALNVLLSMLVMAVNRWYRVQPDESGAIQPPELYFRLLYGCISILGLIALNAKQRKRDAT